MKPVKPTRLVRLALICLLALLPPQAYSAPAAGGGGGSNGANNGNAGGGGGSTPGTGGAAASAGGAGLQAEATALVYASASDAIDVLVTELAAKVRPKDHPIFMVNLPVLPQDILNLYAVEARCNHVVKQTGDLQKVINDEIIAIQSAIGGKDLSPALTNYQTFLRYLQLNVSNDLRAQNLDLYLEYLANKENHPPDTYHLDERSYETSVANYLQYRKIHSTEEELKNFDLFNLWLELRDQLKSDAGVTKYLNDFAVFYPLYQQFEAAYPGKVTKDRLTSYLQHLSINPSTTPKAYLESIKPTVAYETTSTGEGATSGATKAAGSSLLTALGADSNEIGAITDTVAAIANLVATFNPTFITVGGSVVADDPTLQYLLLPKLAKHYGTSSIVDFSQKFPPTFGSKAFDDNSFVTTFDRVESKAIAPLNEDLAALLKLSDALTPITSAIGAFVTNSTGSNPKYQISVPDQRQLAFIDQQARGLATAITNLTAAVGGLETAANGFYESILGSGNASASPQGSTPASGKMPSGATDQPPQGQQPPTSGSSPSVGQTTIQGGLSTTASPYSQYAYVSFVLDSLTLPKQSHYKPFYVVSIKAIVSQGTQTAVKRTYSESFGALSSVARMYLQAMDPTTGTCVFSDEKESRGYQLYFPSRVRFQAEPRNKIYKFPEPVQPPAINLDKHLYHSPYDHTLPRGSEVPVPP